MKRIKKTLRLIAFVFLIVLAGIGVGLSGGIPTAFIKRRESSEKVEIESKEVRPDIFKKEDQYELHTNEPIIQNDNKR